MYSFSSIEDHICHKILTFLMSFLQSYMDSEIMSIMSQYMPLENQQIEAQPLRQNPSI